MQRIAGCIVLRCGARARKHVSKGSRATRPGRQTAMARAVQGFLFVSYVAGSGTQHVGSRVRARGTRSFAGLATEAAAAGRAAWCTRVTRMSYGRLLNRLSTRIKVCFPTLHARSGPGGRLLLLRCRHRLPHRRGALRGRTGRGQPPHHTAHQQGAVLVGCNMRHGGVWQHSSRSGCVYGAWAGAGTTRAPGSVDICRAASDLDGWVVVVKRGRGAGGVAVLPPAMV